MRFLNRGAETWIGAGRSEVGCGTGTGHKKARSLTETEDSVALRAAPPGARARPSMQAPSPLFRGE